MFIDNNDSANLSATGLAPQSRIDWTILRSSSGYAWHITDGGGVASWSDGVSSAYAVRPVFYLDNTINIASGDGSLNNPYMIMNA